MMAELGSAKNLGLIEDKGWISAFDHEGVLVAEENHRRARSVRRRAVEKTKQRE
jgi:hypothetical protein